MRKKAPTLGIHFPCFSEMIATMIEIHTKLSLKTKSPGDAVPILKMLELQAAVAVKASEPPTHSGFVIQ